MKRKLIISLGLVAALLAAAPTTYAQKRKSKSRTTRTIRKSTSQGKRYVGNVGPYDVSVTLKTHDSDGGTMPSYFEVTGNYTYIKGGGNLLLEGGVRMWPGLIGDPSLTYPRYYLVEKTKSGRQSAEWELWEEGNNLVGTMTLTKDGTVYNVTLRPAR